MRSLRFFSCSRNHLSCLPSSEMTSKKCLNHGTSTTYNLVLLQWASLSIIPWMYKLKPCSMKSHLQSALNHLWTEILRTWICKRKISGQMPVTWFSLSLLGIPQRVKTLTLIAKVPSLVRSLIRKGPQGTCHRVSVRILAKYHQADSA